MTNSLASKLYETNTEDFTLTTHKGESAISTKSKEEFQQVQIYLATVGLLTDQDIEDLAKLNSEDLNKTETIYY